MARTDPQVNIRMPQALKERLEEMCIESKRSLNSEIVERLEASLDQTALRLPKDMQAEISSSAQLLGRSEEAEIIERLARGTNTWEMHKVISQLTQMVADEQRRRKKENGAVYRAFETAVKAFNDAVALAEAEGVSGDALDALKNSASEQESYMYSIEAHIDRDSDYLGDM